MNVATTDIQQAAIFDLQEKVTETHELLKREKEFERRHQEMMERRLENAIRIGQNLCDFKATLPHGKFITFVQLEFYMSSTTAENYMNLVGQKSPTSGILSLSARTELGYSNTPATVIEMVEMKQIAPTVAAIREAKREVLAQEAVSLPVKSPALTALQSSDSNEWYTPAEYVNAARALMGEIDVDPASCELANKVIQAKKFYVKDGLIQAWGKRVWLNPPYGFDSGVSNQELWSRTLIERYKAGLVSEAVLLVNANTEAKWFQPLYEYLICFTNHRIRFYNTNGESSQPTQGNALVYFGKQKRRFIELFNQFGRVIREAKADEY